MRWNEPAHEIMVLITWRTAKAQASLRIPAVSPEPSLFAHMKYGSRRRVRPKIRHLAPLDGCACLFEKWVYGGRKFPISHELAQILFLMTFIVLRDYGPYSNWRLKLELDSDSSKKAWSNARGMLDWIMLKFQIGIQACFTTVKSQVQMERMSCGPILSNKKINHFSFPSSLRFNIPVRARAANKMASAPRQDSG